MANHQQQKKIEHFSHKHPLILVETGEEKEEIKSEFRPFLRCYGCTEKIGTGVPYYRCEEDCPLFCLHHACAHLPTTIWRMHSWNGCQVDLQLKEGLHENYEYCFDCWKVWYGFSYVCPVCHRGLASTCAVRKPNEAKHSFHQHPVQPYYSRKSADDLICSVCSQIIRPEDDGLSLRIYYRCNYCKFIVHPGCTHVPLEFEFNLQRYTLEFDYRGSEICTICQEEIEVSTQWAYSSHGCYIHAANDHCLTSTIRTELKPPIYINRASFRKGDLKHLGHDHPLALVEKEEEEAPLDGDYSIAQDCSCCRHKISSIPYYTCIHCKSYHLHKLCALLPKEIEHQLHPECPLELLTWRRKKQEVSVTCDACDEKCNGFTYHCYKCKFDLDIECALRTQKIVKIFHEHPLFLSHTKAPFSCHACDRDIEGSSYQCTSCHFWVHEQCASLPTLEERSSHEHALELIYTIPEKYSGVVVYCRICMKALKFHRWAYHCNRCRYLTHVHDCSVPHRETNGVTINPSDVVHLPLATESILENKLPNGKMIKHHRHPMILFADQIESNAIDITPCFRNLIRGSATWPTFQVDGKDYGGFTFSIHNRILTMQVTGVELPRYIKHESHAHVLESTFQNSSTWCQACEQFFFGRGFKCTICAFTIDPYCGLSPRIIKHGYDAHDFSLTYSAVEGVEEYVCEICEEDVTPRYFYHCEACDQSIHARCIWQAYTRFQPNYILHGGSQLGFLVPPSEDLPHCIICDQKGTFGHGFAFRVVKNNKTFMVHLTCLSEDDVQI